MNKEQNSSQKNILKSTGIIGLSQGLIIIVGIIRTKFVAVLLGSLGVGYLGLYQSLIDLIKSLTGLGISFSAVRDVSSASSENNSNHLSKTVAILRHWVWFTGILGSVVLFLFSDVLSNYSFGNYEHSSSIKILSVVLFAVALTGGNLVILQGLRQIKDIAKANVLGAILGLLISIPLFYLFGVEAVMPSIIISSLIALFFSWFYVRSIKLEKFNLSFKEIFFGGFGMIKLGLFTVITGFASTGTMYLVRVFIVNTSNINNVGLFQAAWTLSSLYLSMILNGMITDYFPSLCAVSDDDKKINELVNDQTEIALLIATPIIIGMLFFLPFLIHILYSSEFLGMVSILQWQIAGDFFKILAWPIGIILLAKGKGGYLIFTELSWNLIYFFSIFFGWKHFGIEITGISFFIGYVFYLIILLTTVQSVCKFKWNAKVFKLLGFFVPIVFISFLCVHFIDGILRYILGFVITTGTVLFSIKKIDSIINIKGILTKFKNKFVGFRNS